MKTGFPHAWYWKADDGRIYSAAKQDVVTEKDAGYVAFLKIHQPTRWPVDLDYKQTDESLLEVISKYGLHLSPNDALFTYAKKKFEAVRAGGVTVNGVKVETDAHGLAELHLTGDPKVINGTADFLKAARATYNTVLDSIKSGKIGTTAQIDNVAWPKN